MLRFLKKLFSKLILQINQNGGLCGYYIIRDHFYQPIPNVGKMLEQKDFFSYVYAPPGLDLHISDQTRLIETLADHVRDFRTSSTKREGYYYTENGAFGYADSMAYYGIISLFKPKRVVEVGAGNSTLVALAAAEKLKRDGVALRITVIEPYPSSLLLGNKDKFELLTATVESVPVQTFEELEENDILFIDSSHIIKTRNERSIPLPGSASPFEEGGDCSNTRHQSALRSPSSHFQGRLLLERTIPSAGPPDALFKV